MLVTLDAADSQGNYFVVEYGNHRVSVFNPNGPILEEIWVLWKWKWSTFLPKESWLSV